MGVDHERDGGDGGEAAADHHNESHNPGAGQSPVDLALLFPSVHGEAGEEDAYPRVACKKLSIFDCCQTINQLYHPVSHTE